MQTTKATNKLYAGADLHGNNVFLSLCDEEGNHVFRRRVKANLGAVNAALAPFWNRIEVLGVESTFNWYWLVDGLQEQGRNVKMGNPAKMEQYKGIKITNDLTRPDLPRPARLGWFWWLKLQRRFVDRWVVMDHHIAAEFRALLGPIDHIVIPSPAIDSLPARPAPPGACGALGHGHCAVLGLQQQRALQPRLSRPRGVQPQ